MQMANRTTKADIQKEVTAQLHARVTEQLESHAERARARIEEVEKSFATMQAKAAENFGKHGEI